jgi:hypothetical protein
MVGALLLEDVGQLDDVSGQTPLTGLKDPPIGVGESGEIEMRELIQRVLGLGKARLKRACRGAEGGDARLAGRGRGRARIAHERLARRRVGGGTPGGEQGFRFAGAQPVAHEALGQTLLLAVGEAGQVARGGGREPTLVEMATELGGEPTAEGQASVHPASPAAEKLRDLRGREPIVVSERADHAGLVHRAHGAPGRVGLEQSGLAHDPGAGVFHDHGHVGVPLVAPAGQALEAIEHLVGARPGRRDPQGQRGQRGAGIRARSPERSERGGQSIERDVEDQAHGRSSASGRSW